MIETLRAATTGRWYAPAILSRLRENIDGGLYMASQHRNAPWPAPARRNLSARLGVVLAPPALTSGGTTPGSAAPPGAARSQAPILSSPSPRVTARIQTQMINRALTKIFGSQHERDVKKLLPLVQAINDLEAETKALSDAELRAKTEECKRRLEAGETLDDLLVPAFAVAREAAWRTLHMRPFDVQLMGGVILHRGRISEMKTGEGKTLMATLPVYLNALAGKGVHVVTFNDYLARRDADWMGRIYRFLGLTVGCIQNSLLDDERQAAYACDVTDGTKNEFGFDYLRDNMKFEIEAMVQRGHVYAIVDEVDSILIDEARTPLIISGPSEENTDIYYKCNRVIPSLVKGKEETDKHGNKTTTGDYLVDEKSRTAVLTEEGVAKAEKLIRVDNLYELHNIDLLHGIEQALRAHALYKRDIDYMIRDGQVLIV